MLKRTQQSALLFAKHNFAASQSVNAELCQMQKRFLRQRKLSVPWRNPLKMIDEYKKTAQQLPSLDDVDYFVPIERRNIIADANIQEIEELRKAKKNIGDELLTEEPAVQEWIDWMNKPQPKLGKEFVPGVSKRTGVPAIKLFMTNMWDSYFARLPVTALWIPNVQVTQVKTVEKDGYNALQLGIGNVKLKNVTKPMMGHFAKANVDPKHSLIEFLVSEDCFLPVGYEISASHFVPGQYVDITGRTVGKGFQGAMKRWNFGGLPASHGVSLVHRSLGSTGNTDHVFKGKKMHGHLGAQQKTQYSNYVYAIDLKNNVVYVKGSVPGKEGSYVTLSDAKRTKQKPDIVLPVPSVRVDTDQVAKLVEESKHFIIHKGERVPEHFKILDGALTPDQIRNQIIDTINKESEEDAAAAAAAAKKDEKKPAAKK